MPRSMMSRFCQNCGGKLPRTYLEYIISLYFKNGLPYDTILKFLKKHHNIVFSLRTLKSRLKGYGLRRTRNDNNLEKAYYAMRSHLQGPWSLQGYRSVWHSLRSSMGVFVPRNSVMSLLRELDPQGVSIRRRKKLKRRCYHSLGPNDCWHIDGYDKIKRFGFLIIGCIDGFSRKILWLETVNSNNDPFVTASAYVNFISELEAMPRRIRTDCGTENCVLAAIQCYFRREHTDEFAGDKAQIYGSSHSLKPGGHI